MNEGQITLLVITALIIFTISRGLRIVPQADKWVVERFGKFRRVPVPLSETYGKSHLGPSQIYPDKGSAPGALGKRHRASTVCLWVHFLAFRFGTGRI